MPASRFRAQLAMLLATALVATSFPVVAAVGGALASEALTLLRFAAAGLLLLPVIALRHRHHLRPPPRDLLRYAVLSAPLVAFFWALFAVAPHTPPHRMAAVFTLTPTFAAGFAWWLLGARLDRRGGLALAAATLSAAWVALAGRELRLDATDLLFLAGTAALGLHAVLIRHLHRGEPMVVLTFWTLVTGAAWLLLLGHGALSATDWLQVPTEVWGATLYLVVFATLLTTVLRQRATPVLGPTAASAFTLLNPGFAVALGWLRGDAELTAGALLGLALTLLATAVLLRRSSAEPAPARPALFTASHPAAQTIAVRQPLREAS